MAYADNVEAVKSADHEKHSAALTSVIAAVFLTGLKLVVGIMTGSLGILAEVAHSALDLVAAVVTLFAVRVSGRPADREHTYGHGKVENLSALFETLLLLLTCVWIIYEAIQRLFFKNVVVEASIWGIAVMVAAIVIDFTRSRVLMRAAKKYDSQALEADALHFSTDIWSSTVVIFGLGLVQLSEWIHQPWLAKADAVAAMGVAGIVIWVSLQLGKRTINGLLDAVPPELRDQIARAVSVEGVISIERVRVRRSGPEAFVDVTLTVTRETSLEKAHDIASVAENAVQGILPGADVVIHVEPVRGNHENAADVVRLIAGRLGVAAHDVHLQEVLGKRSLEFHVEVADSLTVDEAHAQATALEDELHEALPGIERIVSHIEPAGAGTRSRPAPTPDREKIEQVLSELGLEKHAHELTVRQTADRLDVSFHYTLDPGESITHAHSLTQELETTLHAQVPALDRVVIHIEPEPNARS